jgi:hypothetical protein
MEKIIAIALGTVLFSMAGICVADGKHYGKDGSYQGRTENDGKSYGKDGSYQGRTENDGKSYGKDGSYQGRTDSK